MSQVRVACFAVYCLARPIIREMSQKRGPVSALRNYLFEVVSVVFGLPELQDADERLQDIELEDAPICLAGIILLAVDHFRIMLSSSLTDMQDT